MANGKVWGKGVTVYGGGITSAEAAQRGLVCQFAKAKHSTEYNYHDLFDLILEKKASSKSQVERAIATNNIYTIQREPSAQIGHMNSSVALRTDCI